MGTQIAENEILILAQAIRKVHNALQGSNPYESQEAKYLDRHLSPESSPLDDDARVGLIRSYWVIRSSFLG